jgi:hypothetical protein
VVVVVGDVVDVDEETLVVVVVESACAPTARITLEETASARAIETRRRIKKNLLRPWRQERQLHSSSAFFTILPI